MNPLRMCAGACLLVALVLALSSIVLAVPGPSAVDGVSAYQLLTNPGMEIYKAPYAQFRGVNCQVATGWERFWDREPAPYWMDTRVFANSHLGGGWVEKIEGATSQMIISTEPYTAGIQQQVTGLTPGVGYGFHAAMLTIFQTSAQPPVDGTMIKQVGLDPSGGTDPQAPTVVWSEPDDHDQGPWDVERITAAYAQAPTMTVFIRVISPFESGDPSLLNQSFLDSAILARTATVAASSPASSEELTFTVRWDNAVPSPDCTDPKKCKVVWYDVEWLDEEEGVWQQWLTGTTQLQAPFAGQRGHTYRFRARAWQHYPNGAHLFSPYRPGGDTQTYVRGPKLVGQVLSNEGQPVAGATVAISGTAYATTSGPEGRFEIKTLPSAVPQAVTISHPIRLAPAPVYGVTFGPTQTVVLTWTLRPPDDVVVNGGFEAGLDGWTAIADQGVTPEAVAEPVHTGHGAAALGGAAAVSSTVGVTQTAILNGAWEPVLSFWYQPATGDADDRFNVVLTVVAQTASPGLPATTTLIFTPALDIPGWHHTWYYAGPVDATLSGTATVRFQVWNDGDEATTTVYLDEVSLGSTPGGPYRIYLPLLFRRPHR